MRGLLALAEGQPLAESVRQIERTRGKLTYQGGRESQQQLRAIGNALLPAINAIEGAKNGMGNATLRATGSPGLATAAHMAPDAILAALGARPAMAGGNAAMRSLAPVVKRVAKRSAGPTMGAPQSQIGAIGSRVDAPMYRGIDGEYDPNFQQPVEWWSEGKDLAKGYGQNVIERGVQPKSPVDLGFRDYRTEVRGSDVAERLQRAITDQFESGRLDKQAALSLFASARKLKDAEGLK